MDCFALKPGRDHRCETGIMRADCADRLAAVVQRPKRRIEREILLHCGLIKVDSCGFRRGLRFARYAVGECEVQPVSRQRARARRRFTKNPDRFVMAAGNRKRQSKVILKAQIAGTDVEAGSVICLRGAMITDQIVSHTHGVVDARAFADLQCRLEMRDSGLWLVKGGGLN